MCSTVSILGPEFLKAAIMQSHDCAICLRICANFGLMNMKQEKLALNSCTGHNFYNVFFFLVLHVFVSAPNSQSKHFDCANKFAFGMFD